MAIEAQMLQDQDVIEITAPAALTSGQVLQLADGRAGVVASLNAVASGDITAISVVGQFRVAKTASINILDGQEVWWDVSENTATYAEVLGDFPIGVAVGDSLAAATTVVVRLNETNRPKVELNRAGWTEEAALGLGVDQIAEKSDIRLSFDAVAEIAQAAYLSIGVVDVDDGPILEGLIALFDRGDNAALDMDFGLAVGSHASDFEAIAEFVAFHLDGNSDNILAHSDDGTTDVALVDTTVDHVDNTYAFYQIDCRDKTDIKMYINGIRVLSGTTFTLTAFSGNLVAIVHAEKTSDNTLLDLRIRKLHIRRGMLT